MVVFDMGCLPKEKTPTLIDRGLSKVEPRRGVDPAWEEVDLLITNQGGRGSGEPCGGGRWKRSSIGLVMAESRGEGQWSLEYFLNGVWYRSSQAPSEYHQFDIDL